MRICSLVPAATEVLFALGLGDQVVGVTHECDWPPEAAERPHVTAALVESAELTSAEVDEAVAVDAALTPSAPASLVSPPRASRVLAH